MDTIESLILKTVDLPSIPMVAARVMQIIASPRCSLDEIQEVISGDPAVVSRLLRVANSPFFGARRQIDSVQDAVMTMGLETLKNMVLASSVRQVYRHFGLFEKMSWEHSLGVSMAAGLLAPRHGVRQDEAMTAGLLHDIGKVVMNNAMPDRYAQVVETVYEDRLPAWQAEESVFSFHHGQVGELLARKWKLSPSLSMAIGYHHHPERLPSEAWDQQPIAELIRLANAICHFLGVGGTEPDPDALDGFSSKQDELLVFIEEFKETFIREKLKFMEV